MEPKKGTAELAHLSERQVAERPPTVYAACLRSLAVECHDAGSISGFPVSGPSHWTQHHVANEALMV